MAASLTPALLGLVWRVHQCPRSLGILPSLQHKWVGPEQGQLYRMRQHIDGDSVVVGVSIVGRTEMPRSCDTGQLLSNHLGGHHLEKDM